MNDPNTHNLPDIKLPQKYTLVDEYLIRGPHPSIFTLFQLQKPPCRITQIYDFRHASHIHFKFLERWCCKLLGIKYIRMPYSHLYGEYPSISDFEQVAHSVKQNGLDGGRTLFHCNSGRHRTSHFAAFYKLTRGAPLNVVKMHLASEYATTVRDIVKQQVFDQDYFNRKIIEYNGSNPITRALVNHRNMIAAAITNAHNLFMTGLGM